MITELSTAIITLYDGAEGDTLRAANTGGLFWQQAPQAVTEPYAVFSFTGSSIDDSMGGQNDRIEKVDVQFNVVSRNGDGGVEAADIADKFMSLYDWNRFTISGSFTNLATERIGVTTIQITDEIWQVTLIYSICVDW